MSWPKSPAPKAHETQRLVCGTRSLLLLNIMGAAIFLDMTSVSYREEHSVNRCGVEVPEIPERPRKRSQSFSWNFLREYSLGTPKPNNSRHFEVSRAFSEFFPPEYGWGRLFSGSASGEGFSELDMEFPAILRAFLNSMDRYRCRPELSERFGSQWSNGPFALFSGKFVWTNGPSSSPKFSLRLALVHGWLFPTLPFVRIHSGNNLKIRCLCICHENMSEIMLICDHLGCNKTAVSASATINEVPQKVFVCICVCYAIQY